MISQRQLSDQLKRRLSNYLSPRGYLPHPSVYLLAVEKLEGSLLCLTKLWYELPTQPILRLHSTPHQTVKINWSLVLPQKNRCQSRGLEKDEDREDNSCVEYCKEAEENGEKVDMEDGKMEEEVDKEREE